MSRPHVSLIIPVHNAEPFLDRCLDSAAAQTEPQLEIICVDDASTDASGSMLDARANQDSRFRIVHRTANGGESAARNQGVALARGEYLAFLDHDDMLEPDACRLLYQAARKTNADIAKGRVKTIDYNGRATLSSLQLQHDICTKSRFYFTYNWWSALYRSSLVQGHLLFAEGYLLGADILFLTEALIAASNITCVDDLVYTYFHWPDSGDSHVLTLEKIKSVLAMRRLSIERLHEAGIDSSDPDGYRHKIWGSFMYGIDLINHRCADEESRLLCCDYLFAIKQCHRYPEALLDWLKNNMPALFHFFFNDLQTDLFHIIQERQTLFHLTTQHNIIDKLRCTIAYTLKKHSHT